VPSPSYLVLAVWLGWPDLVSWYRFTRAFEALGRNAQGYQEYRHRQTGIVMVLLPGGTYWMGAQKTDPKGQHYDPDAEDDEAPVHEVTLRPFLIGKYEVTQAEWRRAMGTSPSHFTGDDSRPAEQVSWYDIQEFEAKTGLTLPTEAQWEYAFDGGFYGKPEAREPDPISVADSKYRAVRGGSWGYDARFCRSSGRDWFHLKDRGRVIGCRPSRPLR
jgi:formylglycine-generating enzyme required for sulfatase activity